MQTQNLAFGNGVDYEKYPGNPVITAAHLPEGASPRDFRDPKLLCREGGGYRAIVANDHADGRGRMLMFESDDLVRWEYAGTVAKNGEGEQVMSATLYTDPTAKGISFFADGKARFNVRAWALNGIGDRY